MQNPQYQVQNLTLFLCMQYSLLSQERPPSTKISRLEIGLCRKKNTVHQGSVQHIWKVVVGMVRTQTVEDAPMVHHLVVLKKCTSFSIHKGTFFLDLCQGSECVHLSSR